MYLSLFVLESLKPLDYYQLHKELWRFFPNYKTTPNEKSPFFYRVENLHDNRYKKILVQSIIEPKPCIEGQEATFLEENLYLAQTKNFEKSLADLQSGQKLQFFVRAYPSKRLKKEGKSTNRGNVRVPLRKDLKNKLTKDQVMLEWLKKVMEKENCLSVKYCQIIDSFPLRFRKNKNGQHYYGTIYNASFKGYLIVNKPKQFIENIMLRGIGPGKAFGCGMLSIAKV